MRGWLGSVGVEKFAPRYVPTEMERRGRCAEAAVGAANAKRSARETTRIGDLPASLPGPGDGTPCRRYRKFAKRAPAKLRVKPSCTTCWWRELDIATERGDAVIAHRRAVRTPLTSLLIARR